MDHRSVENGRRLRVLCYVNHFFGSHPTFRGKSTTETSDLRRAIVGRALSALSELDAELDVKVCGIEGHALVPLDLTFTPADSTHLVYESLAHMAGRVAEGYEYFLNIEDDIEVPPQTLSNAVEFDQGSLLNEVLHPLRIERRPEGPYLVDLAALPGFTVQQRTWHGLRLCQAINPHCGLMLLSRQKFAYALQFADLSSREVFLGGPMASAYAAIHRPLMLWRVIDDPTYHVVYHLDEWLGAQPLAAGESSIGPEHPTLDAAIASNLPQAPEQTLYAVDTVAHDGNVTLVSCMVEPLSVDRGGTVRITGWAVDKPAEAQAGGVIALVDGASPVNARYGTSRPDVARALGSPSYERSGFEASIDTADLSPGLHRIAFAILDRDRRARYAVKPDVDINVRSDG
jgi:hypothetical protein